MKILHIITGLDYGGAERLLLNICKKQKEQGNNVDVIFFKTNGLLKNEFESIGINVFKYDIKGFNIITTFLKLIIRIKKEHYDVVHTHLPHAAFIGRISAIIAGNRNIITTIHNTDRWLLKNNIVWKILKYIDTKVNNYNRCKIIAISNSVKDFLIVHEPNIIKDKIKVLYNAIDFESINNKMNEKIEENLDYSIYSKNYFVIINVARLSKQKGQIVLLQALDDLINKRKVDDVRCIIIGDGIEKGKLELYIKEHKLDEYVILLGWKDNPYPYLKKSNLFVLPSIYEGFGIAVLEAYYCEVPVLASDIDGLSEVIKDKETGILVEINNPEALADEIQNFYDKKYDNAYLISNAKKFVMKYDIDSYVDYLMNFYKD